MVAKTTLDAVNQRDYRVGIQASPHLTSSSSAPASTARRSGARNWKTSIAGIFDDPSDIHAGVSRRSRNQAGVGRQDFTDPHTSFDGRRVAGGCTDRHERRALTMKLTLTLVAATLLAAPAFAQTEEVTCGDYSIMDNAQQMETIASIESQTSQMASENQLTAEQIHAKLAAECKDQVDVLVIDIVTGK
jgi:hypothetical protein